MVELLPNGNWMMKHDSRWSNKGFQATVLWITMVNGFDSTVRSPPIMGWCVYTIWYFGLDHHETQLNNVKQCLPWFRVSVPMDFHQIHHCSGKPWRLDPSTAPSLPVGDRCLHRRSGPCVQDEQRAGGQPRGRQTVAAVVVLVWGVGRFFGGKSHGGNGISKRYIYIYIHSMVYSKMIGIW